MTIATITWRTPLGGTITGDVAEVEPIQTAQGADTFLLRLTVDFATYRRIEAEQWFNFLAQVRHEAIPANFETDQPVELELALKPALAAHLLVQESPVDIAGLLAHPGAAGGFLLESESWLLYTIWQKVELPEDMAGTGLLRMGYKTLWQTPAATPPASMHDVVQFFLGRQGWVYDLVGESIYRFHARGTHGAEWVCLIKVDEANDFCLIYSILPEAVPEEQRAELAAFLVNANYDLGVGSFEMDMEDGEVRFRTSIDVEGDRLSLALLDRLVSLNLVTMDEHIDLLLEKISS